MINVCEKCLREVIKTIDSTGEVVGYVIGIDKSKKLHFEFEGTEAFVDDVVSGKINTFLQNGPFQLSLSQ